MSSSTGMVMSNVALFVDPMDLISGHWGFSSLTSNREKRSNERRGSKKRERRLMT